MMVAQGGDAKKKEVLRLDKNLNPKKIVGCHRKGR
jgi:hypothetical protein